MLTLQFVAHAEIKKLSSGEKINRILNLVKEDKIVLVEGRLKPMEETELIQRTMEGINKNFKGIELCTVYPEIKRESVMDKFTRSVASALTGVRSGLTVIGPATVIKEIKRDPNKIQLLTTNGLNRKRSYRLIGKKRRR
ncbi:MAG: DUF2073 domain-containing protein [Candidatus Nanoarchaeia archaeon]|nr:DUF2073 domain-containing protein [Candidatus Nanoarchaeia archaeon]